MFTRLRIKFLSIFLFSGYLLLSLLLPEFHPFSRYPMYNSFPNYSYVFGVKDEAGNPVPLKKYFNTNADGWAHLYFIINERKGFDCGNGVETDEELRIVGHEMLISLLATVKGPLPFDSISVNRVYRYFKDGIIVTDEKQLDKIRVE